ncbi:hypothetical protein TRAPUB_1060 [Trametes pubescens]|uniref:Uncharacterized protein n=1 Tax=Trametes pubescens TaxID=154538 RepID=A0A1M2VKF0_TRAPU|nr:hypothetical protein TRAPUB_1060 [Trametes pubescens]
MSSSSSELIDDSDSRVQYSGGWTLDEGVAEVNRTRHGANSTGLQAALSFTGTGIRVIGTVGASDTFGWPTTAYLFDEMDACTYTPPFIPTGETAYNVTFFSARNLSQATHTIIIQLQNATSPDTFWLDYFLVDSAPGPSNVTMKAEPSAERSNSGAIVGATVASGAVLALLVLAFVCFKRRRHLRDSQADAVMSPFTFSREPFATATTAPSPIPSILHLTNSSEMLSTRAVVAFATHSAYTPSPAPPCEVAPREGVKTQPEFDALNPPARSARLPTATSSTPRAALPPGMRHTQPNCYDPAHSPLRSLSSQGQRANLPSSVSSTAPRAADSGLRLYDDTVLPPPYTRD